MMNTIRPAILAVTAATLAMSSAAFAQTPRPVPPVPPAPPTTAVPTAPPVPPVPPLPPHHRREAGNYLGVVATPASRAVTEQLGLPPGFGLVVNSVVPDSPAAAAGVQPYDILQMLNDQRLVGTEQLGALVRSFPDGATVTLTLLRKGQEQKVTAKLVRRGGDDVRDRLRERAGRWSQFLPEDLFGGGRRGEGGGRDRGGERRFVFRHDRDGDGTHGTTMNIGRDSRVVMKDDSGEIEVVNKDGKRQVTIKRADGSVIYTGPADSEEERKKMPEDARKKLDRIQGLNREARAGGEPRRDRGADARRHDEDMDDDDDDSDFIFEDSFTRPLPPTPQQRPSPSSSTNAADTTAGNPGAGVAGS